MAISQSKANPFGTLQFNNRYFTQAVQKTNVTSKQDLKVIRDRELSLSPDKLGRYAAKIRIESQQSKTLQDRFIDQFV